MQEIHFTPTYHYGIVVIVIWLFAVHPDGVGQTERDRHAGLFVRGGLTTLTFDPSYAQPYFNDLIPGFGVGLGMRYLVNQHVSFAWSLDLSTLSSNHLTSGGSMKHRYQLATLGSAVAYDLKIPSLTKFVTPRIELSANYSGMTGPTSVLNIADDEDSPHKEFYGYGAHVSLSLQPRIRLTPAVTLIPAVTQTLVTNAVFGYDEGRLGHFPRGLNYSIGVEFHAK